MTAEDLNERAIARIRENRRAAGLPEQEPNPYTSGLPLLYACDCRDIIPDLPVIGAVMTDPPYTWYAAMCDADRRGVLDTLDPAREMFPVWSWLLSWFPALLARTDTVLWITTDRRYLSVYGALASGTLMQVYAASPDPDERLLVFARDTLTVEQDEAVRAACALSTYGNDKAEAFWAALLPIVPLRAEARVLDPFCGSGSALVAAFKAGQRIIGVDREADRLALARQRIIEVIDGKAEA